MLYKAATKAYSTTHQHTGPENQVGSWNKVGPPINMTSDTVSYRQQKEAAVFLKNACRFSKRTQKHGCGKSVQPETRHGGTNPYKMMPLILIDVEYYALLLL